MHIAIVGCGHGEIDKIYEVIGQIELRRSIQVSLLIVCGDFQSVRNMTDLRCMACPVKYQEMHDFHRYYSGEKVAPVLTIFIGGNHEASNYLQELPFGGWAARNIYYLGNAGVVQYGGIRIAGISGIFNGKDYMKGRLECPPYSGDTMRSVYHYRNLDLFRLKQIKTPIDIMISHDWPEGIHKWGDVRYLLRRKPFFEEEIQRDKLGSRPLAELLEQLKPAHWFAAHLHVKFSAVVWHQESSESKSESKDLKDPQNNPDSQSQPKVTKFLALDKVLPKRQFLQIIEIPTTNTQVPKLEFDPEWLAILRSTDALQSIKSVKNYMPGPTYGSNNSPRYNFTPTEDELNEITQLFSQLQVPENFNQTAQPFEIGQKPDTAFPNINPQTVELCEKLSIRDPLRLLQENGQQQRHRQGILGESLGYNDDNEYEVNAFADPNTNPFGHDGKKVNSTFTKVSFNPDEIELDLDEEDGDGGADHTFQSFVQSPQPTTSSTFLRRKLDLPPPKHSESDDKDIQDPEHDDKDLARTRNPNSESEMEAFKSIFGNEDDGESLFVIDRLGEPESKRSKNQVVYDS